MNKANVSYQERLDELIFDIKSLNGKAHVFILVEGESDVRLFRKLFIDLNIQRFIFC